MTPMLLCALALPHDPLIQYRELVRFIHAAIPNCEIVLVQDRKLPENLFYERLPFKFGENEIWIRRGA
jgi:hypothetical protein